MNDIKTHIVFLGDDKHDAEKPILESKGGLLDVQQNSILKINKKLYEITRMRQNTKTSGEIKLTMQFIYVQPLPADGIIAKLNHIING